MNRSNLTKSFWCETGFVLKWTKRPERIQSTIKWGLSGHSKDIITALLTQQTGFDSRQLKEIYHRNLILELNIIVHILEIVRQSSVNTVESVQKLKKTGNHELQKVKLSAVLSLFWAFFQPCPPVVDKVKPFAPFKEHQYLDSLTCCYFLDRNSVIVCE